MLIATFIFVNSLINIFYVKFSSEYMNIFVCVAYIISVIVLIGVIVYRSYKCYNKDIILFAILMEVQHGSLSSVSRS